MPINMTLIVYAVAFLAGLAALEGGIRLYAEWRAGSRGALNKRLQLLSQDGDALATLRRLRREQGKGFIGRMFPGLELLLTQSGILMQSSTVILLIAALGIVTFIVLHLLPGLALMIELLIACAVAAAVPYIFLAWKRARRVKHFGEQLPDLIEIIVRSLRAGHPVRTALALVSREMSDPAGTEFGIVSDEMTYGLDLEQALHNLSRRMPNDELRYMVITMQIQATTGGNLAEVLDNLSRVLRDRFNMLRKARAITGEQRLSAIIIGLGPVFTFLGFSVLRPDYYGEYLGDPLLYLLLGIGAVMWVIGMAMILKLINFKV